MDATPATASAADITSPKSAMLANGVVTVGSASDGIIGEDNVIYNARVASSSVGTANRGYEQIIGGTVCWNQKLKNIEFAYDTNWTKTTAGSLSVSGNILTHELRQTSNVKCLWGAMDTVKSDHVVFISFWWNEVCSDNGSPLYFRYALKSSQENVLTDDQILNPSSFTSDTWYFEQAIVQPDTDIEYFAIGCRSSTSDRTISLKLKSPQVIDLTQLFGETIANHILSLETTNAGDGIAFFRKYFKQTRCTNQTGKFKSVYPEGHIITGFNNYNPNTGIAELIGGLQYQITGAYTALSYSDINSNSETISPDSSGYFTPSQDGILTVTNGNTTTTCIHLVKDGSRDNEWQAFKQYSYILSESEEDIPPYLFGVIKLNQNNDLIYDGDIYRSDGTITRHFMYVYINADGNVVLPDGTIKTWSGNVTSGYAYVALFDTTGGVLPSDSISCFCSMYEYGSVFTAGNDKCVYPYNSSGNTRLTLRDTSISGWTSATTGAELATAVQTYFAQQYALGNYFEMIIKLANPTIEYAKTFANPQIIDSFSTEKYLDFGYEKREYAYVQTAGVARDFALPIGHSTKYFDIANPAKLTF